MTLWNRIPWSTIVHVRQRDWNDKSKILEEPDVVEIRPAGYEGEFVIRKADLIHKSGFFRAMFSSNFQEANSASCTLHDDHAAGLVVVIRYILDGEMDMLHGPSLVQQYLGMPKHELVNEAFIEADKYDVPWLRRDLVSHLHHTAKKEEFLENHYYSLSEAFGGSFLVDLYPTFASALAAWHRDASLIAGSTQSNEGDAAIIRKSEATRMADVMKVAAMEDPDLTKYLLGYVKF